jgi:hypothetical protein
MSDPTTLSDIASKLDGIICLLICIAVLLFYAVQGINELTKKD